MHGPIVGIKEGFAAIGDGFPVRVGEEVRAGFHFSVSVDAMIGSSGLEGGEEPLVLLVDGIEQES